MKCTAITRFIVFAVVAERHYRNDLWRLSADDGAAFDPLMSARSIIMEQRPVIIEMFNNQVSAS